MNSALVLAALLAAQPAADLAPRLDAAELAKRIAVLEEQATKQAESSKASTAAIVAGTALGGALILVGECFPRSPKKGADWRRAGAGVLVMVPLIALSLD